MHHLALALHTICTHRAHVGEIGAENQLPHEQTASGVGAKPLRYNSRSKDAFIANSGTAHIPALAVAHR
eukprot:SAG31_NODE_1647_length_7645_cov_47.639544_5_plen_69_part_00